MGYIIFSNKNEDDTELTIDSQIEEVVGEDSKELVSKLTPEQKKTIMQWISYLGKALIIAILKKLTGTAT